MGGRFSVGQGCGSQEGFPEEVGWSLAPFSEGSVTSQGRKKESSRPAWPRAPVVTRSPRPLVMKNSLPLSWRREVEVW